MPKVTPASQDSKVLLVSPVLRVSTVGPVPQVSLELPEDQESSADQDHQVCQERRVRQAGTGSQDQRESKESQGFLVMVDPAHLGFQDYQVQREIQVFRAHLAILVSQAPKETLVSLALLVLQATLDLQDLLDWLCRAQKDSKDPLDHLEEQVDLGHRVPVDPQEVAVLRERRVSPAPLASRALADRKEILVLPDSRGPLVFPEVLVQREISVCLVFLDSPDQRETQDSLVAVAFLEILEMLDPLALLVILAYLRLPSW